MTQMSVEEKREYLELYVLQQAKINRYSTLSAKNSDKKRKYKREIESAMAVRDIIEDDINKITDFKENEVLAQKYLCGKSFEEIANMLNYSRRQVERIHLNALEHFEPAVERLKGVGKRRNGKNDFTLRSQ